MRVSALPRENRTNKILYFCSRENYHLTKIRHKTHFFTFLSLRLTVHPFVRFSTAYNKNVQSVKTTGTEMVSPFLDISVNDVLLQTNPDFTSHFLDSSGYLVDTVLHDSQTL